MNLTSLLIFLSINWVLIFFICFFAILIFLIFAKKFNLLTLFLSLYFSFFLISIFLFPESQIYITQLKKEFLEENKGASLDFFPSSFLRTVDGRGKQNIFSHSKKLISPIEFPLSGAKRKTTIFCKEDEILVSYESDRFGFRNKDSLWEEKKQDILILGDSFAHGACVDNSISENLNKKSINSISLGQGGNGLLTSYAVNKEYISDYQANITYLLIYYNDYSREEGHPLLIDFEREIKNTTLKKTLLEKDFTQGYFNEENLNNLNLYYEVITKNFINQNRLNYNKYLYVLSLKPLLEFINNIYTLELSSSMRYLSKKNELLFIQTLNSLNNINNKRIFYIILPNKRCFSNEFSEINYLKSNLSHSEINENQILDLSKKMCNKTYFAFNGVHFNKDGYEKISNIIYKHYIDNLYEKISLK